MIVPKLKDDAFLADVAKAKNAQRGPCLWWLGQSGFLVQVEGRHILFDPYLSDSLAKKYANTEKPHDRMTGSPVDPARLDFIDVVTSTHNHTDHLDGETLGPIIAANKNIEFVIPEANREFVVERLQCDPALPVGLVDGETATVGPFEVTGIPAAHEAMERDADDRCKFLGYVVKAGDVTVYHSGDTIPYDGLEALLRPHDVDVALLPINGAKPERNVAGNLDGRQAAQLAHDIGARTVIPCHYDMFAFNTETPELFRETCEDLNQGYRVLACGQRWEIDLA